MKSILYICTFIYYIVWAGCQKYNGDDNADNNADNNADTIHSIGDNRERAIVVERNTSPRIKMEIGR
jgi:hypothetical protein